MILFGKNVSNASILITAFGIIASIIIRSPNIIIISASIFILYELFTPLLSTKVFDSKVFSSVLIFFCYIILLQCSVLISWVINHNFPLTNTPALLLIIILIIYYYNYLISHNKTKLINFAKTPKNITIVDIISLVLAAGICLTILLAPLIQNPGSDATSTIAMSLVNGNVDDAAHLGLVNDHLQFNRGVLFGSDAQNTRNNGFYPVGWHSISAILIKTLCPSIATGSESLLAYGIQKLFWSLMMFYLLLRSSFVVFKFAVGDKLKLSSLYWLSVSTTLLACTFLLPIIREGFYSLFPQLITVLLAIPILIQICTDKDRYKIVPILLLIFIGGCLSWLLPLPAFGLALLSILIWLVWDKKPKATLQNFGTIIKQNLPIIFILATATIIQVIVMISNKSEGTVSFIQGIILDGGITKYSSKFFMFIIIGFLVCVLFANDRSKKNMHILLSLSSSILLFCIFIYLLQMGYIGRSVYYYFKILDILILSVIPFSAVGVGILIQKICGTNKVALGLSLTTMALGSMLLIVGPNTSAIAYAGGYRDFPGNVSKSLYDELKNDINQNDYSNKKNVFYYVPGVEAYVQNEVANMLAKSNKPDSPCFNAIRKFIWWSPAINNLLSEINKQCAGYQTDIVTDKNNFDAFSQAVIVSGLAKSITIKTY